MKWTAPILVFATLAGMADGAASGLKIKTTTATKDRTVTKVVKLLQEMMEKSKADGENDRFLYAKFKCWCDQNIQEKEASIEKLNKLIKVIEAKIAELMAENGKLSLECAELTKMIAAFKDGIAQAVEMRKKEKKTFVVEEEDLTQAIQQCENAIATLAEVGADQTQGSSQEHKQFMAGFTQLDSSVRSALLAASMLAPKEDKQKITAFIQAPFTGTYSAQSGEVVGILKNMLDTFKANKDSIITTETKSVGMFKIFMATKTGGVEEMKKQYKAKQEILGENDDALATQRVQLEEANAKLKDDEEFLAKTKEICRIKAKEYEERVAFRANEESAIAEATGILNSDAAFETFGKSAAGSSEAKFLQLRSTNGLVSDTSVNARNTAGELLRAAVRKSKSLRLAKVEVLLETGASFDMIFEEIDKVLKVMAEEGEADKTNLDWCNAEREENHEILENHIKAITLLEQEVDELKDIIHNPETGLLAQIDEAQTSLKDNHDSMVTKTQERGAENKDYQSNIKNIVAAQDILHAAVKVLKDYYASMTKAADAEFFQQDPPATWDSEEATKGGFEGQKKQGGAVIEMLDFILEESEKEEMTAHKTEKEAQHEFEDEMADLKKEEADLMKVLAELNVQLAEKEAELKMKEENLAKETEGKIATEDYLEKIKPGCDFITEHFEAREESRATEKKALKKVVSVLKGSPAFKAQVQKRKEESWGECKEKCLGQEEHVECKACLAKVTIPGYCAGHPETPGC